MNHSFESVLFNELVEPVHQIGLNFLQQFTARAAQIYKLLNQNSLSDTWLTPTPTEMSQNSSVSDPVMNELIQCSSSSNSHWTEETMSSWYEHVWTEHLNEGAKWMFLWFLIVYVKKVSW